MAGDRTNSIPAIVDCLNYMTLTLTATQARLQAGRLRILEMMVRGQAAESTLEAICKLAEQLIPGAVAGITIVDPSARTFERAIVPSLPSAYAAAIPGIPVAPPHAGSCVRPSTAARASPARTSRPTIASAKVGAI